MTFAFHAAPRPGEWFNDPNGLAFADGRYLLYMQHSAAAPDFKRIGWGVMSSPDLLDWQWCGVALAAEGGESAYSGSVTATAPFAAFFTRHDADRHPALETQWRAASDDGLAWTIDDAALAPAGRNLRDPFVWRWSGGWRMLLAEPCDWTDWPTEPPSRLSVWASDDLLDWRQVGTIGPGDPPGVMWEVPLLLTIGDVDVLIVSVVDRRGGRAVSSVQYAPGRFDGTTFIASGERRRVDLGPDFYAACCNTVAGWPASDRTMIGWASNWATARSMPWPGRVHGGPIALPRTITWSNGGLHLAPVAAAFPYTAWADNWQPGTALRLQIEGDDARLMMTLAADGRLVAVRDGGDPLLAWTSEPAVLSTAARLTVFVDAGLVEVFIDPPGVALTAFVPGASSVVADKPS